MNNDILLNGAKSVNPFELENAPTEISKYLYEHSISRAMEKFDPFIGNKAKSYDLMIILKFLKPVITSTDNRQFCLVLTHGQLKTCPEDVRDSWYSFCSACYADKGHPVDYVSPLFRVYPYDI